MDRTQAAEIVKVIEAAIGVAQELTIKHMELVDGMVLGFDTKLMVGIPLVPLNLQCLMARNIFCSLFLGALMNSTIWCCMYRDLRKPSLARPRFRRKSCIGGINQANGTDAMENANKDSSKNMEA